MIILIFFRQDNVYDVLWIPRPVSDYPDRPRSPSNRSDPSSKSDNEKKVEEKKPASTPYRLINYKLSSFHFI